MTHFSKYHGAGNDFIIIDGRQCAVELDNEQVAAMCHRRFGIGADGLMTLTADPAGSDFLMRYWNADGGESTMCGNGGRCIALFANDLGIGLELKTFNAVDGLHTARILPDDTIELQMIDVAAVEQIEEGGYFLNTGSPHVVLFVDDTAACDVVGVGREYRHRYNANVNFVEICGEGRLRVRTFERGVEDETLACGTGVTAAAIAVNFARQPQCCQFVIEAVGGALSVRFDVDYRNVYLRGGAVKVFEGNY